MTPEEIVRRREVRIDSLIDRVEGGGRLTVDDWQQLDELNTLDLMSAEAGGARELLELEAKADGILTES
jgi:hypothetical protein